MDQSHNHVSVIDWNKFHFVSLSQVRECLMQHAVA